ncbi:hypothetical protein BX666DRAFT_1980294 [Dichotomocladium elegans]|nr:hypothetical protein BX666DRAFT_1980294 [Dichotomocladium elegans]
MRTTMLQPTAPAPTTAVSSFANSNRPDARWRPLPSVLIDFIAITLCDVIPFRIARRRSLPPPASTNRRPLPELVYFIQKITYHAGINCRTAVVALILLDRAKAALPKNATSSYDTCHRLLLGALLLASKILQGSEWAPAYEDSPLTNRRLCDLCGGLFSLEDMNQVERAFLKLIQYQCWVDDKAVNDFVRRHRTDLAI